MTWLVTGGAGYIGAHVAREIAASGRSVVVFDDLSTGLANRLSDEIPLVVGDVRDSSVLSHTFGKFGVSGVVHLAAKKAVGESVEQPLMYYDQNIGGVISLLAAMNSTGVKSLVYSSSAAVYGTPDSQRVSEDSPTNPESPYGETKLIGEWLINDQSAATDLRAVSLRYFNVVGAGSDSLGDTSANNLVPLIFSALRAGKRPQVFGDDYPTPDGTCIRDYIDVRDLAAAHVEAIKWLEGNEGYSVFNVGRGSGVSVKEMMRIAREVTVSDFEYEVLGRRAGDPPQLIGEVGKAAQEFGWVAKYSPREMVDSAWKAWGANND